MGLEYRRRALVIALAAGGLSAAHAADWTITPSISSSAELSDNSRQSSNSSSSSLAVTVSPTVSARTSGQGPLDVNAAYALNATKRFGGRFDDSDIRHQFSGDARAELVREFFFIDARASIDQQLASLLDAPSSANVNRSNRRNAATYELAPNLVHRFGNFAVGSARYSVGGSSFEGQQTEDASTTQADVSLSSGAAFSTLGWTLSYSHREAEYDTFADSVFERFGAAFNYRLSRQWRLLGTFGEETNDYASATTTGGGYYTVGLGWAPNTRTDIEFSAGERYFGKTFNFRALYRTRSATWTASYVEDVSDITRQLFQDDGLIYWVCGNPPSAPILSPVAPGPDCVGLSALQLSILGPALGFTDDQLADARQNASVGLGSGVFVFKGLNTGINWQFNKYGFGISLSDTKRAYQIGLADEDRSRTLALSGNYRFGPKTQLGAGLRFTNIQVAQLAPAIDRDDDQIGFDLSLSHRYSPRLLGYFSLSRLDRSSNDATADYTENRLSASFNYTF